jgi:uncharacterized protein (UPF0147 family)
MPKKTKKQITCEKLSSDVIDEANFLLEDHSMPRSIQLIIKSIPLKLEANLNNLEVSSILYLLEDSVNNIGNNDYRSIIWGLISKLERLKENMK